MRLFIVFASALALLAGTARGAMVINVGQIPLFPDRAGQSFAVYLVSDALDSTQGLNFNAQLGDGGPILGGVDITPLVTADATGPGTLFEFNHNPPADGSVPPSFENVGFAVMAGYCVHPRGHLGVGDPDIRYDWIWSRLYDDAQARRYGQWRHPDRQLGRPVNDS